MISNEHGKKDITLEEFGDIIQAMRDNEETEKELKRKYHD